MIPGCVIWDLDGTICDTRPRAHILDRKPIDWRAYAMECPNDKPIKAVIKLRELLGATANIIVTGRHEDARRFTERWLLRNRFVYTDLYMRPEGDHRENGAYKADCVRKIRAQGFDIKLAVDDYPKAAEVYERMFIPTLLVARDGVGHGGTRA